MDKFNYHHIHSGVIIEELEKNLLRLKKMKVFDDGEKHEVTTNQSIKSKANIVVIKPEHKKYVTWVLRGERKSYRPVIDKTLAEKFGLMIESNEVFSAVKVSKNKFNIATSFIYIGKEHCPPCCVDRESKEFQKFWRYHALIKEADADESSVLGLPWWSMSDEDFEKYWKVLESDSSKEDKLKAKKALFGKNFKK